MPHHAELPPEETFAGHASPANDPNVINLHPSVPDFDDEPLPVRAPLRFGRLALWMASASALGIGVLGTVAYSMWFNHDQRVYAEAMSSARRTLGIDQPGIAPQTQSAGVVEAPVPTTTVSTTPIYPASTYALSDGPAPLDTAPLADNAPPSDTADADSSDGANAAGAAAMMTTAAAAAATQAGDPPQSTPAAQAAAQRRANGSAAQQTAANRANQTAQARRRGAHAKPEEGGLFARVGAFFHRVSYRHNVPSRQREEYSRP